MVIEVRECAGFLRAHFGGVFVGVVAVADEVEKGVDEVERNFAVEVATVFAYVLLRDFRADERGAENGVVDWKGDAIGGGGVIEDFFVNFADLLFCYEVDFDRFRGFFVEMQKPPCQLDHRCGID